jgi:hypothetical protein
MKYMGLSCKVSVAHADKDILARFKDKEFASYAAIVKQLQVGESVIVAVHDEKLGICMGFGEVKRETETSYFQPRMLQSEY